MLWIFLIGLLIVVVLMAIALALTFRVAVNWSTELIELQQYGVESTGRVTERRQTRRRGATSTWIRYEYVDQFGKRHRSRRNLVTPEAWSTHIEGGPISIVYSQRRPKVSSPKYLLNLKDRVAGPD
jgi:hypothetical protein